MAASDENSPNFKAIYIPLIWLDANIHTTEDNKNIKTRLNRNFGRCHFSQSIEECQKVLDKSLGNANFVLIVSGHLGLKFVPSIHDYANISSIYVYCGNVEEHKKWANNYTKIKYVVNNPDDLISRIRLDHSTS